MSSPDLRNGELYVVEVISGIESDESDVTNTRVCKFRLIASIIAYSASVFFVVVAAAYVCLIVGALVYLGWWAGLALIAFLSPYFVMMLRAIPFLRDVYINDYATSPAPKGLPN